MSHLTHEAGDLVFESIQYTLGNACRPCDNTHMRRSFALMFDQLQTRWGLCSDGWATYRILDWSNYEKMATDYLQRNCVVARSASHRNLVLRQKHRYVVYSTMFQGEIHESLTRILSSLVTHEHSRDLFFINHLRQAVSAKK